jgi:hypothetical protein
MFYHRNRFAEFGCSDGRLLSTGARTDDDEVVLAHGWVHVHLLLILDDAAPRTRLTRLYGICRGRSGFRSSSIVSGWQTEGFRRATITWIRQACATAELTSSNGLTTTLLLTTVADYYQSGMPRVVERCFHRIISRDQAAHVDVGVAQLPAGQRVSPHAFGLEVHAIAPSRGRPMGGRNLRDICGTLG